MHTSSINSFNLYAYVPYCIISEGEMGMLITVRRLGEPEERSCRRDEGGYVPKLLGAKLKLPVLAGDKRRKKGDTRFCSLQQRGMQW